MNLYSSMNYFLISLILFFWELPQNLLGMIYYSVSYWRKTILDKKILNGRFRVETIKTGVSLGWFVFYTSKPIRFNKPAEDCLQHELGHSRQSMLLGPLYLILVGIPSIIRVGYSKYYRWHYNREWKDYFRGYPENWADKLGGVYQPLVTSEKKRSRHG